MQPKIKASIPTILGMGGGNLKWAAEHLNIILPRSFYIIIAAISILLILIGMYLWVQIFLTWINKGKKREKVRYMLWIIGGAIVAIIGVGLIYHGIEQISSPPMKIAQQSQPPTPKGDIKENPAVKTEQPRQTTAEEKKKGGAKEMGEPRKDIKPTIAPSTIIMPLVQVTPLNVEERPTSVVLKFDIFNDSDNVANNILVDIKFGDSLWKKEAWKSSSIDFDNKMLKEKDDRLIAAILSEHGEQKLKEMLKNFLDSPTWGKLEPHKKITLYTMDENKDFIIKQKMFFHSNGKDTPIDPKTSTMYQVSQGWREQIDNTESGKPIKIVLYVSWENEMGKIFVQVIEYQLICTKIGTGRSYKFLPTGNIIKNYD